jgi:hypothetical protein
MADAGKFEPGCCLDRRRGYAPAPVSDKRIAIRPSGCTPATCMRLPDGQTCGDCATEAT